MDPLLLAAMTLVTLTAGGVFTWLLVRRASADLSAGIAPELGRLQADLTRHAREQSSAQGQQLELQRQLEQGLASLATERTAQSRRLDQIQASLEGLLSKPNGAEGAPGEILRSLQEVEQRLTQAQQPDWPAMLDRGLRAQLTPLMESNGERWNTEAARWANLSERLEASEARLLALGGRLGQVLELVERLAQSSQSVELAVAQLQMLPSLNSAPLNSAPLNSAPLNSAPLNSTPLTSAGPAPQQALTTSSPEAGSPGQGTDPATSTAESTGLQAAVQPLAQADQLGQDSVLTESGAAEPSGPIVAMEGDNAGPVLGSAGTENQTTELQDNTSSQPPLERSTGSVEGASVAAQQAQPAENSADTSATATEGSQGNAEATDAELSQLELTARQLRESLLELEAALNSSSEQAAIARAENQLLRAAAQADLERLQRRHAGHIQAIAQGLAGLDATLDRTLARSGSEAHRHNLSA